MHKLGFYLQRSDDLDGQLFDAVRQVQPPVLLVHTDQLNDQLLHLNRRDGGPNAFVVGRHFKTIQEEERLLSSGDPAQNGWAYGEEIAQRNFAQAKQRGENGRLLIDAWMSLNEIIPGPASQNFANDPAPLLERMAAYDAFQEAFRRRLQQDGIEAVAFNFAAGNYTQPEHYLDHFPKTLGAYTYLGFHEYGWHHLNPNHQDALHGKASSGAGIYRRIMAGIRNAYGDRHKVIVTEAGMTREYKHHHGFVRDGRDEHLGDLGWLCFTEQPPLSEDEYFSALRWYNDLLVQDDYVLGCCLYQVGHTRRFEAHRHIGRDNAGNPLHLMQRIAALNQPAAVPAAGVAQLMAAALGAAAAVKPTVQVAGGRFWQGDQPLGRFTGVNLPGLLHLPDAQQSDLSVGQYLDEVRSLGASVVRVFVPHHTLANQEIAARLVAVLPELAVRDMYMIPVLIDLYSNSGAYPRIAAQWLADYGDGDERVRLGPGFFTGGYASEGYQEYIRTVVQSIPAELSHTIFCWEIGNELKLEHPGATPPDTRWGDPAQFVKFCGEMASIIKRLDPHQHLVTTGMISTQHVYLKNNAELIRQLYLHPDIDFLTVHVYYGKDSGPVTGAVANNEPDVDAVLARSFGKPLVVEEAGINRDSDDFGGRLAADLRRWFQDTHWEGQERQPASGYLIWRPPFGAMRSGHLHDDGAILRNLLLTVAGMAPMMARAGAQWAVSRFAAAGPLPVAPAAAPLNKIGLDLNRPINGRQPSEVVANPGLVAETGAGWVRLNFVLQDAPSPEDAQWQATYARIIGDFRAAGLKVYGLIGGEAVKTPLGRRLLDSVQQKTADGTRGEAEAWLQEYEHNFVQIVRRFGAEVPYFESFNEPDNWAIAGEQRPVVHPTWFAQMLDRIWHAVKQAGLPVKLVSGPLLGMFHHQPSGEAAPAYLRQVYDEGRRLGWHSAGRFPFDSVGYHLYLKPNQQTDFANGQEHPEPMDWDAHAERVAEHYATFIRAIRKVVRDNEGPASEKRLVISEMGWDSADDSAGWLAFQAASVTLGLQLLADDPAVDLGFWFCTRDFPANHKGLFGGQAPLAQARKPAFAAFREFCRQRFGLAEPTGGPAPTGLFFGNGSPGRMSTMNDPRAENARQFATDGGKVTGVELAYIPVAGSKWELVQAALIDEGAAQGNTIARVIVKDKNGIDTQVLCYLAWPWGGWQGPGAMQNRLLPGSANYPYEHVITNKYSPPEQGPLSIYIGDAQGNAISDVIGGLGLPYGHHVSFHLVFRERSASGGDTGGDPGGGDTGGGDTGDGDTGADGARLERIEQKLDRLLGHFGLPL